MLEISSDEARLFEFPWMSIFVENLIGYYYDGGHKDEFDSDPFVHPMFVGVAAVKASWDAGDFISFGSGLKYDPDNNISIRRNKTIGSWP